LKAYYSIAYGGDDVSRYGDFPYLSEGINQLLVKVKAVSLNRVNIKAKPGDLKFLSGSKFTGI